MSAQSNWFLTKNTIIYLHFEPWLLENSDKGKLDENLGGKVQYKKCDFSISLIKTRDKSSDISFQKIEFSIFLKFLNYMVVFMEKQTKSIFQYKK